MRLALFVLLALAGTANAQAPITLNLGGDSALPTKYVLENVDSMRFVDKDVTGKSFSKGDEVQVLFEADGLIRIKKGPKMGWVKPAALSDDAPTIDPGLAPAIPVEGSN